MAAQAWPFLIARGRQRGYSVLLAPRFLLAEGDYGFLEEATGPVPESNPVRVGVATSQRGRRFGLAWSEHRVTAADIGGTADPRDEHSRPLRLLYGFLSADTTINAPDGADLDHARRAALDTYRRFLTDEHRFTTEPSTPLDTRTTEPSTLFAARTLIPPKPPPARRWVRAVVISAAVVIGAATAVVVAIASGSGDPPPSCTEDTSAAGSTTTTSSCGSPTQTTTPDQQQPK
jgi:hypothetical protein